MNIYANMAYQAPSSLSYMQMTSSALKAAADQGDAEAAGELARRRANVKERSTYGRYLAPGEAPPAGPVVSAYKTAVSEAHRAMAASDLRAAAAQGDAAAAAELERRAHNRAARASK